MTTYRRAPGVFERRGLTSLVLLAPGGAEPVVLDGTGPAVWAALAEPHTLPELAAELAAAFDAPPPVVEADILPLLQRLTAAGVLLA